MSFTGSNIQQHVDELPDAKLSINGVLFSNSEAFDSILQKNLGRTVSCDWQLKITRQCVVRGERFQHLKYDKTS